MTVKDSWIPPHSPYSLIQESLFPSEWLILVSCVLLNRTSRKQTDSILCRFQREWPTPDKFLLAEELDVKTSLKPLGFYNRRYTALVKLAKAFKVWDGTDARDLPAIGEYATRAWEMFCRGELGNNPPNDGALVKYWTWAVKLRNKDG